MADWTVVLEPHEENPDGQGRNMSGMIIFLEDKDGDSPRKEHSSVAYTRRHSKNPTHSFKRQLGIQVALAVEAAEALNTSAAAVKAAAEAHAKAHAKATGEKAT